MLTVTAAVAAACTVQTVSTPSTSPPTAASTPSALPAQSDDHLFAVLQVSGGDAAGPTRLAHDGVAIMGRDGRVRARASFQPRRIPQICMAAPVLQPEATVADGALFFMDGKGVVRRLDPDGSLADVAAFNIGSQDQFAFAVRPDGRRVMASIITNPTYAASGDGPCGAQQGGWRQRVEVAAVGGIPSVLWSRDSNLPPSYDGAPPEVAQPGFISTQLVAWDRTGPVELVGAYMAMQNDPYPPGHHWYGGHLARAGEDGKPASTIGGADCRPWAIDLAGRTMCLNNPTSGAAGVVTVRSSTGERLWSLSGGTDHLALSPDGRRIAMTGAIVGANGSRQVLPRDFYPEGWLDATTLIGRHGGAPDDELGGNLALLGLSSAKVDDFGFRGSLAGVVR